MYFKEVSSPTLLTHSDPSLFELYLYSSLIPKLLPTKLLLPPSLFPTKLFSLLLASSFFRHRVPSAIQLPRPSISQQPRLHHYSSQRRSLKILDPQRMMFSSAPLDTNRLLTPSRIVCLYLIGYRPLHRFS